MRRHLIYIAALLAVGLTACKEEKKTSDIITRIVHKPETRKGPQQLSDFKYERAIEWLGSTYTVRIRRYADRSLPMAADEDGRKYYDNRVALLILRKDGTTFFDRTFTKDDFRDFTDNQYGRHGALVGFMIDRVEGNTIYFGASVGSPDPNSDEYVPSTWPSATTAASPSAPPPSSTRGTDSSPSAARPSWRRRGRRHVGRPALQAR